METLFSCPAYDVIEGPREKYGVEPCLTLAAGDELACKLRSYYTTFQIGSVVSSSLADGRCPLAALERAKGFGHDLHFIFALSTSITSHKQARKTYIGVTIGQRVRFEGRYFEIVRQSNDNLGLKDLGKA